jgi:hypothetical protein
MPKAGDDEFGEGRVRQLGPWTPAGVYTEQSERTGMTSPPNKTPLPVCGREVENPRRLFLLQRRLK